MGNGFNAPVGPQNDYASGLEWKLPRNPASFGVMKFGVETQDGKFYYRQGVAEPGLEYAYMHQGPAGGAATVVGMRVSEIYSQLLLDKQTNNVSLKLSMKWWNLHRTQHHWGFSFLLLNSASQSLAVLPIEGFVIDCQCTQPPNDYWEITLLLPGIGKAYYDTVAYGQMLPAESLYGDHGVVCG